ncbi:MAG: hypothetical protein ACJ77K_00150 [Bacteroidia bacterium]
MKKNGRIIYFLVSFFCSAIAYAQDSAQTIRKFELGISPDLNMFVFTSPANYYGSTTNALGAGIGIHTQYNFTKKAALLLDCTYEVKSWKTANYYYYSGNPIINYLHTVTVPVLFKYSPGEKRYLFLTGGPYFGVITKLTSSDQTIKSYGGLYEFGPGFGLGLQLPMGDNGKFSAELRDYLNLSTSPVLGKYSNTNTTDLIFSFSRAFGKTTTIAEPSKNDPQEPAAKTIRRVYFKPFVGVQYCYRKKLRDEHYIETDCHYNANEEIAVTESEFGLQCEIDLTDHINVNSGIAIDNQGFSTNVIDITYAGNYTVGPGSYSFTYYNQRINYKLQFVSVPIIINYQLKKNRIALYAGTGFESKFLSHSSVEFTNHTKYSGGQIQKSPLVPFYILNIGTAIDLSNKLTVFIEPNFKYELGTMNIPLLTDHVELWSAGCRVGVRF